MSEPDPLPSYFDPPNGVFVHGERRRISRQQWTVLRALWRFLGKTVSHDVFFDALYPPAKQPPGDFKNLLKVTICRLRAALVGLPLRIETVWGKGYRLLATPTPSDAAA